MLFTPVHVIFLELIMGPTCSIIYENEPLSPKELKYPVHAGGPLLKGNQVLLTVTQGLMITLGCAAVAFYASEQQMEEERIRTYVFCTLIFANIFLTLMNRSFHETVWVTLRRKNRLLPLIILISCVLLTVILYLPFLSGLFGVEALTLGGYLICMVSAFLSTWWLQVFIAWRQR